MLRLDERGLLPPGVHDSSLEEVVDAFGFAAVSSCRMRLAQKLEALVYDLRQAQLGISIVLDGSFVMTAVEEPNDIDAVLVLPHDWNLDHVLKPFEYRFFWRKIVRDQYGAGLYPVVAGTADEDRWLRFFAQIRPEWSSRFGWPTDIKKGLARIRL
jgi:hypothetical protein